MLQTPGVTVIHAISLFISSIWLITIYMFLPAYGSNRLWSHYANLSSDSLYLPICLDFEVASLTVTSVLWWVPENSLFFLTFFYCKDFQDLYM